MTQAKHIGIWKGITVSLAVILAVALAGAGRAQAQSNTDYGNGACASGGSNNPQTCGTGGADSAFGDLALSSNTTGSENTGAGYGALGYNTTGSYNTAVGYAAADDVNSGQYNTATGYSALIYDTTGSYNDADGANALDSNSGSNNIGIGYDAGDNLTTGSYDIDIGNHGVAAESDVIRIGVQGTQTDTYIAGIDNDTQTGGTAVYVNSNGLLFIHSSSARYKRDINDMGNASSKLMKLRPVTFRYKNDQKGTEQYGLIAEEVERVYPEMVEYGAKGEVEGVHYDVLPAMLLNEMQKQARHNRQLTAQVARLTQQIGALKKKDAQIDALNERMNAVERQARLTRPEHLASAMP
jgi:hypothetical protein